jgi:CHAT domain
MSFGEISALSRELEALETQSLQRESGRLDELLTQATLLEARARRLGVPHFVGATLLRRAAILNSAERWRDTVEVVHRAQQVLAPTGHTQLLVSAHAKLAEAYAGLRDWNAASAMCDKGIALVERDRYKVSAPYMRSSYLRFAESLYRVGVEAAFELGDVELLLRRAELAKARGTLRDHAALTGNGEGDEALERRFQEVGRRLEAAEAAGSRDEAAALRAERRRLWDLLAIGRLRSVDGRELPALRLRAVQERLAADEAVISYFWVGTQRLLVVTLDASRVAVEQRSFSSEQIQRLAEDTSRVMTLRVNEPLDDRFFRTWSWLLPEVEWLAGGRGDAARGEGAAGIRRLLISPHQALHAMPFHALHWHGRHVIERFAVTFIPNLSSLLLGYRASPVRRLLAIGIDHYKLPGDQAQPPPLARAEAEARAIAGMYEDAGAHVIGLYNAAASAARLRRWAASGLLSRFDHVHLAGHAENVPSDTPLESRLYLHDAVLDGLEIAGWRLPAELVVLSACSAGQRAIGGRGISGVPGDELFGLHAALFAAGARRIISSLWPVDDGVGLKLTLALHRNLVAGCTPEVAHQRAVQAFLEEATLLDRRPYYWAPFYVAAMGRPE